MKPDNDASFALTHNRDGTIDLIFTGTPTDVAAYLEPVFREEILAACRAMRVGLN